MEIKLPLTIHHAEAAALVVRDEEETRLEMRRISDEQALKFSFLPITKSPITL